MAGHNGQKRTPAGQAKGRPGRNGNMPPKDGQFKPGESGNPTGSSKKQRRSITAELRKLIDEGFQGKDLAEALAQKAVKCALAGDHKFWQSVMERIEGKVPDRLADADGATLRRQIMDDIDADPKSRAIMQKLVARRLQLARMQDDDSAGG